MWIIYMCINKAPGHSSIYSNIRALWKWAANYENIIPYTLQTVTQQPRRAGGKGVTADTHVVALLESRRRGDGNERGSGAHGKLKKWYRCMCSQ